MAISKENTQVYVTLPKEVVAIIDKKATSEMRSRSKEIAKIVIEHVQKESKK